MSELSTVAIKDGHRGHLGHHRNPQEAERADRISRLAGLERVATARQANLGSLVAGAMGGGSGMGAAAGAGPGVGAASNSLGSNPPGAYFDANNQPQIVRERSTVGSASATGSVGGRTTWASGSDNLNEADRMSEEQETSSMGGLSDEAPSSLVGVGEGARTPARQHSALGSPSMAKASAVPPYLRDPTAGSSSSQSVASTEAQRQDARMMDGMTYDANVVDTAARTPPPLHGDMAAPGRLPESKGQ